MIDWDRPIETVDGRKARLVETHRQELWLLVWVEAEFEGPGDVYLVNAEGCRCDSRSIEMGLQTSQFIRNVPVKIEGWAVVKHYPDRGDRGCFVIIGSDIVQSEAEAREFHLKAKKLAGSGCRLVHVVMTEQEE